ncbi:MAG: hypothetical protein MJ057_01220 [Sphaerochaetaceae bacterium]|nr:hypothetical protein [Sphaerochaetaceae bacterium]
MKKLSIVLFIFIAALPSVFAATLSETHEIRLKTRIGSETPVFQFEFTSGMRFPNSDTNIITNKGENAFDANVSYNEYGTQETAIEVEDISRKDLDLLFTVYLANEAKSNNTYTLRLNAGGFAVTRFDVPGTVEPMDVLVSPASDIDARVGVRVGSVVDGSSIDMCFNGAACRIGKLATFEVLYQRDGTIDPSLSGYFANITLEISSSN